MRYEADISLVRHGMTLGNEEHRYIGTTDEPLSKKGREQPVSYTHLTLPTILLV